MAATQGMMRKYFEKRWRGKQDCDYVRLGFLTQNSRKSLKNLKIKTWRGDVIQLTF